MSGKKKKRVKGWRRMIKNLHDDFQSWAEVTGCQAK